MENAAPGIGVPLCLHFANGFGPYGLSFRLNPPTYNGLLPYVKFGADQFRFSAQQGITFNSVSAEFAVPEQFRPMSWRTVPCRHFMKHRGWCPLGDGCGFIHDLSLPDAQAGKSHCWLHVSSNLGCKAKKCRYFHPHDPVPYRKHTPCPGWATCGGRGGCPFKHPEQLRNGPGPGRPAALLTPRGLVNQWAAVPCFGGIPNVNLARPQYAVYN